ncbi:MAG: asparagine synthase (glutamine-hydrolyzing) [Burkholderiales bacterium]|nr:asparagine synthase (glutamine-hydrolyzing) [Burkholderiales bacterium]
MCGIAGFFGQRPIAPASRAAMLAAIRQRGPDSQHQLAWGADGAIVPDEQAAVAALLHARLAIIDPRPEADQPMPDEAGDVWLCYNGEAYGWKDDADVLRRQGVQFRTRSDTEFILHAYKTWGIDGLLNRLRGMFAFAILDRRSGKLYLARDRMGEKPLIYAHRPEGIAFASTVRALLPWLPADERRFDGHAIDAYLAHRYIPAPRTIYAGVQRLENGHYLSYDLHSGQLDKHRYWVPKAHGAVKAEDALFELEKAVEQRTVADRPLGVFLSGGIDSSCMASILAATGHQNLTTYTAAFPGSSFDESADAAEIARLLSLRNHPLPVPTAIAEDFARIVADLDEPFADPSSFPTWYLARETAQHVKVVIGGDGGDEVFAGYKRHPKHLRSAWRAGLRLPLRGGSSPDGRGLTKTLDELGMDWQTAYSLRFSGFTPAQRRFLQGDQPLRQWTWWRAPDVHETTPIRRLLAIDFANTLPEYILRKGDLCTMAHGLELRAPMLDHGWLEKLFGVAAGQRFTQPAKRMLDVEMPKLKALGLFERKKRGFNPPLKGWLRGDLAGLLDGMGKRLESLTAHQLQAERVDALVTAYGNGQEALAENVLQLLILDESLAQLDTLNKALP